MLFDRTTLKILHRAPAILAVVVASVMSAILTLLWRFGVVELDVAMSVWLAAAVINSILVGVMEYWERGFIKAMNTMYEEDEL